MGDIEEKSLAFLEKSIKQNKVFIDTCSILSEQADKFWGHVVPLLQREGKHIVVPKRVYEEVAKFATNPELCAQKSPTLNQRAKKALNTLGLLRKAKLIEVYGEPTDNFADNVFQTVFTQYRMKYNLMLITQDHNLAVEIEQIGKSKSVKSQYRIQVERINYYGFLSRFGDDTPPKGTKYTDRNEEETIHKQGGPQEEAKIPDEERFAFAKTVEKVNGMMKPSQVPAEGDTVSAVRGDIKQTIRLGPKVNSGGEGCIYETEISNIVAKIYRPEKVDRAKYEKLTRMMTKNIDCDGVCFPLAVVYNTRGEFVGYLMKKAQGRELQKSVFIPQLLKKHFPDWTKRETVMLCITILKKLCYLHDRNIVLGDINPNNILVVSPTEVYFVDTDSYQIEGFPCPVGTINFTAPEIQRKKFDTFLRTIGNERFAVATLLFMIMLPGKPPYALQGGENQIDNIINGDFAYASGERSNGRAPEGVWRFCWSHLPRKLKDDFYETFHKDGQFHDENTRCSTSYWLKRFEEYLRLIESGKLAEQDAMSLELFPTRLKKNRNATYIRCRLCGEEVEEDRAEEGICQECLRKGEVYRCARCGKELIYTNYQKYIKRRPKHKLCKDCYDEGNMVYARIQCHDCGTYFEITNAQKESYIEKGLQLPKRCKSCREKKKMMGNAYRPNRSNTQRSAQSSNHSYSTSHTSSNGFCFITTAVCEYFQKPDDCYELTTLRQFRDGWLAYQPDGPELIRRYYEVAPNIVRALNQSDQKDVIYAEIWKEYIQPCIKLIELQAYSACKDLYEKMIFELDKKLIKEC